MEAIKIEGVSKQYKDVLALDKVNLAIDEGELFGLLGVNGAGKTTLIKILCGLTKKTEGSVSIMNYDLDKQMKDIKRIIDVSPQETSIAPNLSVYENLIFFAKLYDMKDEDYLNKIIQVFGLEEVLKKRAKKLSGGYQRRLSIACALISKPKILFLDEPTLGLDVLSRRELWKIILKLKQKITVVLTTHYLEEIEALCDRVSILFKGHILITGTINQVKESVGCQTLEDAFIKIVEEQEHEKNVDLFE